MAISTRAENFQICRKVCRTTNTDTYQPNFHMNPISTEDFTEPIPPPSNDIHIVNVAVHGYEEEQLVAPSIILTSVIRGNISPPSAL